MPSAAVPIVSVRADCSGEIGYGHIMRCLSVAHSLNQGGDAQVRFFVAANSDATPIKAHGMDVHQFSTAGLGTGELMTQITPEEGPVLLDSYDVGPEALEILRSAGFRVAMFDDGKRLDHYPCDLVVDSAPAAAGLSYTGLPSTRFCLGADYFPLREAFLRLDRRESVKPSVETIIVTFGGSDHDDLTVKALEALADVPGDFQILAILGPAYTGAAEVVAGRDLRVRLHRNPVNVEALLNTSDIAVTAGGGTASELAFLGIPLIMLALSTDQVPVATAMAAAGVADFLGRSDGVEVTDIARAVASLRDDLSRRQDMSAAGRRLVDGKGADRVARSVISISGAPELTRND